MCVELLHALHAEQGCGRTAGGRQDRIPRERGEESEQGSISVWTDRSLPGHSIVRRPPIDLPVFSPPGYIRDAADLFDEEGRLTDGRTRTALTGQLASFADWIGRAGTRSEEARSAVGGG